MTTTSTTRFARVLGCMTFSLALAATAPLASAQTYGSELLVNGNFEAGSGDRAAPYRPAGWNSQIDGTNFWVLTTDLNPAPTGAFRSPNYVGEGDYAIRRTIYQGQGVGTTTSFHSDTYNFTALPGTISAGDQLLFSMMGTAFGNVNNFAVWGRITFFNGATELVSFDTDKIASITGGTVIWDAESITVIVPEAATGFRVSGVIGVNAALTSTVYGAFDNFSVVQVIPEPATVSAIIALVIGAGAVACRRKQRKA